MKRATSFAIALAGMVMVAYVVALGENAPAKAPMEIDPAWSEFKWPFPLDQWGVGRAFVCKPVQCGVEVKIYLRPKIGFCKCATGVDDDEELERVGDIGLLGSKTAALAAGRPIEVGWMNGRSRAYAAAGSTDNQVLSIAFNDRCDVVVAVATLDRGNRDVIEPAVIAFLNSDRILRWVKWFTS